MSTVVRLPSQTHAHLTELAQQRRQSPAQFLTALVEAAWREAWMEAVNAQYAAWMTEHPEEYAADQAEMRLWDSCLADGLEPEA
jgi:predicted transcriptional regulator